MVSLKTVELAKKFNLTPEELIKKAKQEKWYRNNLSYLLHSGQKVIDEHYRNSPGQLFVGNIARQFGKSYWAVTTAIQTARSKAKARIKYGTAFHSDLVEFILPTFDIVLQDCPESQRPKFNRKHSKFIFPNGSEIKLVGLDRAPNSLRGNTIDLIIIDEAGFVTNLQYIYTSVIVPATLHRPNCKIVFISTPPSTPVHPFSDFIQRAEAEGCYVKLDIYQNPRITQKDIDRMAKELGGYTSTTFRRECLCELITDDDLSIIPEWSDECIQEVAPDTYHEVYHRYVGMDMGTKHFTALIFGYYDFKKASLVIEDEFHMSGPTMNTEILAATIKAKEKEVFGETKPFRRIADNNNPHLILDLSSIHNLTFIETNKENLDAMVNEVRIMCMNKQVLIHPRCKMLIGCLKYGVWTKRRDKFAESKVFGHFDHLAALMYLIRNLAKNTNPIPVDHGYENHRSWLMNVRDQRSSTHNSRELEKAFFKK
mgnify:CR=1 FL=1